MTLLAAAHHGSLVNRRVSQLLLDWLAPSFDLSMVASAFDLDPLAHVPSGAALAARNKTGTDDGVRAEVGLLTGPLGTTTYAVICNHPDPSRVEPVLRTMRGIGKLVVGSVTTDPDTGTIPETS
ncbi:hypothetical protein ACF3NT_14085 [Naumannella halotolerans]|uniref:hypothetical protein n=1 Tax=Naumannella halotolerans TaxID=993414 RepID=UPI00370DBE63